MKLGSPGKYLKNTVNVSHFAIVLCKFIVYDVKIFRFEMQEKHMSFYSKFVFDQRPKTIFFFNIYLTEFHKNILINKMINARKPFMTSKYLKSLLVLDEVNIFNFCFY